MTKEKETVLETDKPQPQAPDSKVKIELEYDMLSSNILMRSKAPTVVVSAVLRTAEFSQAVEIPPTDEKKRVYIEYDMLTDTAIVQTDANPLILRGILVLAFSMLTQSQILQRIQAMQAKSRILGPNGERPS